ncbi:HNH endonuclease [Paenalkalicoccus suaedae]|uniref:HNH endonuclease n=1 Tax=Paenalkalicoccus suaedae TaxID=2592382 RepID=A0A859FJT6_9BACI|nr:HNH endonuclease [Paenalkalicoccus suaedae]QKS73064.1 HNH endonuclease [Paenalkalicoccus suaedae]
MSQKLQIAEANAAYITEQDVWSHFNYIFSSRSKNSTSYKFVLIKSLLENLYNVNSELELNYYQVFESFTKIYWNLVIHHKLNQINMTGKKAGVQSELEEFQTAHSIDDSIVFDKLPAQQQLRLIKRVIKRSKINVMGAIYGDTKGHIYSFDNKKEYLKLTPSFYKFMQKYQKVIMYLANYQLALFLEKFNESGNTEQLLFKIENVSKRSSLDSFYHILLSLYQNECFYCGKPVLNRTGNHVDHFIPWSFIQTDQLWNLVIACRRCNTSKNDKLADDHFLEKLINRNTKLLEINIVYERTDMQLYTPNKLDDLYRYSVSNGYTEIWVPRET